MLVFVFDGSFDGLLTAIFDAYISKEAAVSIVTEHNLQASLVDRFIHVTTNTGKAGRIAVSVRTKMSRAVLETAYHAFLSESEGIYTAIYDYLSFGWQVGPRLTSFLTDSRVMHIDNIVRKVTCEVHRMLGLIRFRQLEENLYYAPIEPDHNITELVAPHFRTRLSDQNWVIHDVKRNIAAVYDRKDWIMVRDTGNISVTESDRELFVQLLWKKYFNSISIKSRENSNLQRQFMPGRYWKYLVEKQL